MTISIVNRVPDNDAVGISPYQPAKFTLKSNVAENALERTSLDILFGYARWFYIPDVIPEETFGLPYVLTRSSYTAGEPVGEDPEISVVIGDDGHKRLIIQKTAGHPQDGFYSIGTPRAGGEKLFVIADCKIMADAADPQAGLFVGDNHVGHVVGIRFLANDKIDLYGAPSDQKNHNWKTETIYVILWDHPSQKVRIWVGEGFAPLWEVDYSALTQVLTGEHAWVQFGLDGPDGSSFALRRLRLCTAVKDVFRDGAANPDFLTHLQPNSQTELQGLALPPMDERPWAEIGSGNKSLTSKGLALSTTGSTHYLSYADERLGTGSFSFSAKLAVTAISHAPEDTVGAGINIDMGTKTFRLNFLKCGTRRYVGILQEGGMPWNYLDHERFELDWREQYRYTLVYSTALERLFLYLDECEAPQLTISAVDVGSVAKRIDVGLLDSDKECTLEIAELRFVPVASQAVFALVGAELEGLSPYVPAGDPPSWADQWMTLSNGVATATTGVGETGFVLEFVAKFDDSGPARPDSYIQVGDGTHQFQLRPYWSTHGKVIYLSAPPSLEAILRAEIDAQTKIGAGRSLGVNWAEAHLYRLEVRQGISVKIFLDNDPVPIVDLSWPLDLPSDLDAPYVRFGSGDSPSWWRMVRFGYGTGWDTSFARRFEGDGDAEALSKRADYIVYCEEINE